MPQDTSRDMMRKERQRTVKLTRAQVDTTRERCAAGGITQLALAGEYRVTEESISNLLRGHTWVAEAA